MVRHQSKAPSPDQSYAPLAWLGDRVVNLFLADLLIRQRLSGDLNSQRDHVVQAFQFLTSNRIFNDLAFDLNLVSYTTFRVGIGDVLSRGT